MTVLARPLHDLPIDPQPQPRRASDRFAVSLRGLGKRFGDNQVLEAIDLDIAEGQFVAVIGKSGCGKSTLLRILADLDSPTSGSILRGTAGHPPIQTRIMFQEPRLLPWASVVDNVAVGLTGLAGGPELEARALAILDEVGLAHRARDWPSVLSGGQKQRVALARALVGQPHVLALDEPLGALDALTRMEMQDLLERVWRRQGFAAVLVTHDVSEAVVLADRIVVLDGGRIVLDLDVPLPRPRRHGAAELARLEARILGQLLGSGAPEARPRAS
ncbi:MAG: ATP-binding cassette domain-containing protein [Amaricoccus sp.]